ncbi:hypothetical protein POM88_015087 [Heracleum sosnowskyi]|uniref:RNase H type-1 domain-containing protein n=1 Tax=Heracleum sosnowskyi TaxID=360622 RepID=A0AAD8IKY3_9APIA|nr:hypothetical protein POM88_015087 [Heracleum sosnowskyi]
MTASVGGIMKEQARWVRGLGGGIGLADPLSAELWAIYYGLKMAWECEKTSVVVFTESRKAIEVINNRDPTFAMASLIEMITMLLGEDWSHVDIQSLHADVNLAVNALANYYLDGEGGGGGGESMKRWIHQMSLPTLSKQQTQQL